jgi:3-polyprenyl-4-hydroxybenzoate decarboxylase
MGTRFDPVTDIDIVQKAWSSGRDPMFLPGNFNNRILIDACMPYNRKLKGEFPKVVEVPEDVRAQLKAKFSQVLKSPS